MPFQFKALLLFSSIILGIYTQANNLVRDGKFLKDSVGVNSPDWKIIPSSLPYGSSIRIDNAVSYSGGRSIRFSSERPVYLKAVQTLKIKPKTWYLVNASVRGLNLKAKVGFNARVYYEGEKYKGLGQMGPGIMTHGVKRNPETFKWIKYSRKIYSAGHRTMTISLCTKATGIAWFDNIEVFEITKDMDKEMAAITARELINKEIATVKKYAQKQKDNEVLKQLQSLNNRVKKWYPSKEPNRKKGLPFYSIQNDVYTQMSKLLSKKYPNQKVIISKSNPFKSESHLRYKLKNADKISVNGLQGDIEQFALNFTNCSWKEQKIIFTLPANLEIKARKVLEVEVDNAKLIDDILYLLPETKAGKYELLIPAGMTKQLWFEYKLPQKSGLYDNKLSFKIDNIVKSVDLQTKVFKDKLPSKMPIRTFTYSFPYGGKLTRTSKLRLAQCARDLTKHHQDSYKTEYWNLRYPYGKFDKEGNLIPGSMDWSGIDKQIKDFPNQTKRWLLYLPQVGNMKLLQKVNTKRLSPLWKKCMSQWLKAFVKGLKKRGIGYDNILIEWRDEPPKYAINYVLECIKFTRKVDPKLKIFSNFVALEIPEIKKLVKAVDVIAPEHCRLTSEIIDIIKRSGKEFYSYRVQAKTLKPQAIRESFWLLRKHDIKGYSFWCYLDSCNSWKPEGAHSYSVIYGIDNRELTPSKRWEAWREGIEDYALLTKLKSKNPKAYKSIINSFNSKNLARLRKKTLELIK